MRANHTLNQQRQLCPSNATLILDYPRSNEIIQSSRYLFGSPQSLQTNTNLKNGVAELRYEIYLKLRVGAIHELPLPLILGVDEKINHTQIQQRLKNNANRRAGRLHVQLSVPNPKSKMSLTPIAKIAIEVQTQPGWEGVRDWGFIVRAWESTVSPTIASRSRPKSLSRDVLTIATTSASLTHQLTFGRQSLCRQLNDRLAGTLPPFVDLRFASIGYNDKSVTSATEDESQSIDSGEIVICAHCSCRCRQGELWRWGVCQFCAITCFERGYVNDLGIIGSR